MATWLRQSTSVDVPIGPFLDDADGKTAETALTITQPDVRLKKNNGNWAQKNAAQTLTHEEAGWYEVTLDATDTNTLGVLLLAVHESGALPVWREFLVVPAQVWDSFLGSDVLQVDVAQWLGTAAATPTVAGVPEVDLTHWLGTAAATPTVAGVPEVDVTHVGGDAQSATDLKDFADAGYDPAANKVEGVKLTDTLTTYTGNTPQTGDAFARLGAPAGASVSADIAAIEAQTDDIGAAGAGLTAIPWNAAWDAEVQSEAADALTAYDPPTHAELTTGLDALPTAGENADAVWDEAASGHTASGSFGQAVLPVRAGTAQAGAAGTITLDAGASGTDDFYNNQILFLTGGTGVGQSRIVSDYVGSTKVASVNGNWATNPDSTSVFVLLPFGAIPGASAPTAAQVADAVWDEPMADHLTGGTTGASLNGAGSAGDPWTTALPGAYGAGTAGKIIGDNLNATVGSRATQTSVDTVDDLLDTEVAAIKAKTDNLPASPAAVGSEMTLANDAITSAKIAADAIGASEFAQAAADKVWATAARSLTDKVGFALSAAGIQAIWDALTSALTTAGSIGKLLVDNVNATIGSRASQTSVDTVDDFLDTEIADIRNRLPAALVSGRIDASVGAMAADVVTASAIAANAIGASELAADAVAEIQSGLATAAALATVQADTDDIQTRLPAALVGGRMDSSVGAMAAGVVTAAAVATGAIDADALATDAVGEIADGVWDEPLSGHLGAGSTGAALNGAGAAGDPWGTALPGAYGAGTAGNLVGTRLDAAVSSRSSHSAADVWAAGTRTLTSGAAPSAADVADAVWDELLAGHAGAGSAGAKLAGLSSGGGTGAIQWAHTVTRSDNGQPIADAAVWVTTDLAGTNIVASGTTDAFGVVTFQLDAGTYFFWRQKSGYEFTPQPDTEAVA